MCINIAILGSCATRDNFYSDICSKYQGIYNCCFYQDKASIISMMSDYKIEPVFEDLLNDNIKYSYIRECNKTIIQDLINERPDYIILDFFADVYFGVTQFEKSQYYTCNIWYPPLIRNKIEGGKRLSVYWDRFEYISLFLNCFDEFLKLIQTTIPDTKIIMHRIKFVDYYKNVPEGKIIEIPYKSINEANLCFCFLEEAIAKYNLANIDIFSEKVVVGDYNHRWGCAPFHYEQEYYENFIFQLNKICLSDLVRE